MIPTITIASISGKNPEGSVKSILQTEKCIPYPCDKLLISPWSPPNGFNISHVKIEDFGPLNVINKRKMELIPSQELPKNIKTDFCILVHDDGYAIHPENWTDDFLNYDYIGAPLPLWESFCLYPPHVFRRVGSGGFCLRSQKWIQRGLTSPPLDGTGEDIFMCRKHLRHWTDVGCKVAPVKIALKWCIEYRLEDYPQWNPKNSFGFHGFAIDNKTPLYTLNYFNGFLRAVYKSRLYKRFSPPKLGTCSLIGKIPVS